MSGKLTLILLAIIFYSGLSNAQIVRKPMAASYLGLGAYSLNHPDIFSFSSNQASLAQIKKATAGIYAERRFLLNELNNYMAAVALPTSSGNFGLETNFSGFSNYNETQIGLAYARKLGSKLDIGAQFNYYGIRIAGYGSTSAVSFELGTILHITDKFNAGIHINNPVGGKFGKNEQEKLSSVYTVGFGYDASEKIYVSTEIQKEEDQPVNVNVGLQYEFLPQLLVKAGMETATSTAWAGIGVRWQSFHIHVTTSYHPQLGITPGLLILFHFNQKTN